MQIEMITIYVICDDYLKAMDYQDDEQAGMTTALVAARFFKSCLEHTRILVKEEGYVPSMLSDSRLNRRLHRIAEAVGLELFHLLGEVRQQLNDSLDYGVDSLPIAICDPYRIPRCRLYRDHRPAFRGYMASKHRYFYGLRAHVLTSSPSASMPSPHAALNSKPSLLSWRSPFTAQPPLMDSKSR